MSTLADQKTRALFRAAIARVARAEVGQPDARESPPGSNKQKYGRWYGANGVQWCAIFASWTYGKAAVIVGCENPLAGTLAKNGFAGTQAGWAYFKKHGWVLAANERVMLGDIVIWRHTPSTGHTGVVSKVYPDGSFDVTEGNTSPTDHSSRDGGEVATHHHSRHDGKHDELLGLVRATRKYGK